MRTESAPRPELEERLDVGLRRASSSTKRTGATLISTTR
jgi:hypothetical protein